ncbi:MarR family winged helix-turn-helix transcriptional regulator [Gorillibacterium sp. sgz500922]|uniref:MarR family winged helix-turn-helix transcriptional regulator n=1 Tax=Gorillibacterium sp. sgz500922 TaxID=3446694 RepID=UPI003F662EEE
MNEDTVFELIHGLDKFTNRMMIRWNKSFQEDLGISHILVMSHLQQKGSSRPSDIARDMGLTPSTLSYLADKLVCKALAVRTADESDRRILRLSLTESGEAMLERATEEGKQLRKTLFDKLTEEERAQLSALFQKLNRED